jgi:signal peptidase I
MRDFWRFLLSIAVITLLIAAVFKYLIASCTVFSNDMEPNLQAGERLIINKLAYYYHAPQRGDIILYKSADGGQNQLKRVIGLPADIVEIQDGTICLNGHHIIEPYVRTAEELNLPEFQVPLGSYFVIEDNRNLTDAGSPGQTLNDRDILGKAWVLTWPPDHWGAPGNFSLDNQLATAGKTAK